MRFMPGKKYRAYDNIKKPFFLKDPFENWRKFWRGCLFRQNYLEEQLLMESYWPKLRERYKTNLSTEDRRHNSASRGIQRGKRLCGKGMFFTIFQQGTIFDVMGSAKTVFLIKFWLLRGRSKY